MVDGDYSDNIVGKPTERKKEEIYVKYFPFVFVLIFGFLIGTIFGVAFLGGSNHQIVAQNECSLRNTDQIIWIPSLVTQSDLNENVVGIPVCIPFDKNTGNPVKMG